MNAPDKSAVLAHLTAQVAHIAPRMFTSVSCSQCGCEFPGAGRAGGFSHCTDHRPQPSINHYAPSPLTPVTFWSDCIGSDVVARLEIEETERHALYGSTGNSYLVELVLAGIDIAPHLTQATVDVILGEALTELRKGAQ